MARWVVIIEEHYTTKRGKWTPMDIEWALCGKLRACSARSTTADVTCVQARPSSCLLCKLAPRRSTRKPSVTSSAHSPSRYRPTLPLDYNPVAHPLCDTCAGPTRQGRNTSPRPLCGLQDRARQGPCHPRRHSHSRLPAWRDLGDRDDRPRELQSPRIELVTGDS